MKIFLVLRNADFTEGRGPMLFHKAFVTESKMIEFLNSIKSGIFGAKPPYGMSYYEYVKNDNGGWSGYEIRETEAE
jgi:hypothetical protein